MHTKGTHDIALITYKITEFIPNYFVIHRHTVCFDHAVCVFSQFAGDK